MHSNLAKQFFVIEPGSHVTDGAKVFRVSVLISTSTVLAVDVATNESHRLPVEALRLIPPEDGGGQAETRGRDVADYSKAEWQVAQRRFSAIKPLLDNPFRTKAFVQDIAKCHGIHAVTLYRWLAAYHDAGHVSALVPSKRGRTPGTTFLNEVAEAIVQSVVEDNYLHKQRRTPQQAIGEVERRCRLAKIAPPHANTVRNRINRVPNRTALNRRGKREEAENLYGGTGGSIQGADYPFALVQIDHTPADIICVDEVHRKPVARPYLTLAIDVFSRMVAGFYLSYDPPSAASVGLCLAQAMCPKREYLAELGVAGTWPVWGRPGTVHCDNAREFRGNVLERACEEYAIDLQWRRVKRPRDGAHIERLMGTVAKELHKLPGTTFANPRERKGYNSEAEACLTLKEVERHLADFFVNVYHQRSHHTLGRPPIRVWEAALAGEGVSRGPGLLPLPRDPERITLDFMPFLERTVQTYGIKIDKISYYDPVLDPYVNALDLNEPPKAKRKRLFTVRRDPRDISKVYFFDPLAGRYHPIPYRNLAHPAISLYELMEVRRRLAEEGKDDVDEEVIFEAIERMRAQVDAAQQKSKAARRKIVRRPGTASPPLAAQAQPRRLSVSPPAQAAVVSDDPFAEPIRPFEQVSLKR